jgi:hypothetical protein
MTKYIRTLLSVTLFALLTCAAGARNADSLFNPKDATDLTTEQRGWFGPRSGSYKYDKRMIHAAQIAANRARGHSISRCWRYVKQALLASKVIETYPKTAYAKQAGTELSTNYGFKKIKVKDPYKAPVGSVLVYGGKGPGHVEIRTAQGFVSDFSSQKPSPRPLIGVYVKPRA